MPKEKKQIAEEDKRTNTMALLGFIFAFVFSILGLIFSIIALNRIDDRKEKGRGLATAGLIISIIIMVVFVILLSLA